MDPVPQNWPSVEKAASFTADLNGAYIITATATVTDPTGAQGKGFICYVRAGTATIGGTAYASAGTVVWRSYNSGAWSNAVLPAIAGAYTWTGQQTFTQPLLVPDGTVALPGIARSAGSSSGISWSGTTLVVSVAGVTTANVQQNTVNAFAFGTQSTFRSRRANGTEASPTQVLNGEVIGEYAFTGYHGGAAYGNVARFFSVAREDFTGSSNLGCSLSFSTIAVGSGTTGVRWRINASGQLCFGDSDALTTFTGSTATPPLQLAATGAAGHNIGLARFNADATGPVFISAKSKVSVVGSYTATTSGDDLLRISAQGVDTTATNFREAAATLYEQDGAGGASAVPGRIVDLTANSAGTMATGRLLDSNQRNYLGRNDTTFSGNNIYGVQDGTAQVAGQVGEELSSTVTAAAVGATGVAANATSVSVTRGAWKPHASVTIAGGATGLTNGSVVKASIVSTSATNGTLGSTMVQQTVHSLVANGSHSLTINLPVINISATTTYFLVVEVTYAAGTPTVAASLMFDRLR